MSDKILYTIEDSHKRQLQYYFTPAAIGSNFIPLIVILDDANKAAMRNFEYKMWHVLTPVENEGMAWLGEEDDFYIKDLLQKLIMQIAEEHECEEHIYFYGAGKGGYGAILHGILSQANAIYTQIPQIRLEENKLLDKQENDLTNFLNAKDTFPIFYLSDEGEAKHRRYIEDTNYFMEACKKQDVRYHLNFCAHIEGEENRNIKQVLDTLERMISQ